MTSTDPDRPGDGRRPGGSRASRLGGIVHAYLGYDPVRFPSPAAPPPDVVSGAFEHLMAFGEMRPFTEADLADAVHLDPSQIQGLGPTLESLVAMLEERKRKILERYETSAALVAARSAFHRAADAAEPPEFLAERFQRLVRAQQLRDLERLWYRVEDEPGPFPAALLRLVESLGDVFQVESLDARYDFTGRERMTVPKALEIKEELEAIDRLLEQLREAMKDAKVGLIDADALARFADESSVEELRRLQSQVEDLIRREAERQGLERGADGYRLSPRAFRIFQGRLLELIFSQLQAARSGRHTGPILGEGAVETTRTRPYEFGDSPANMDVVQTMINAMVRRGDGGRASIEARDIEIHVTRNTPKCATAVILDMSGSMRYGGMYVNAKRMALALDGLIRREYPGDFLQFIEMSTFARPRTLGEIPGLMPRPVTIHEPVVRLRADMSDERIGEHDVPPHFTNIQHALRLGRRFLGARDTPNRQIILITDGLPTAHFEDEMLYLLYPPHPRTEEQTMREALACGREGITINVFLLPSWSQSEEDVQFAHRMAEATRGRVLFTGGHDLDRYVVWDYLEHRRSIIG